MSGGPDYSVAMDYPEVPDGLLQNFAADHLSVPVEEHPHLAETGYLACKAPAALHQQFVEFYIDEYFVIVYPGNCVAQRIIVDPATPGTEPRQFTTGFQIGFDCGHGCNGDCATAGY